MAIKNIVGQTFHRLTVVRLDSIGHGAIWECQCECGKKMVTRADALRSGATRSCGCYNMDRMSKHGMSRTAEYRTWQEMWQRCSNPSSQNYKGYGGRGIKVCSRWKLFDNFYIDMGARPTGKGRMSLDRINNNLGYTPKNCRWANYTIQGRNRRNTLYVISGGKKIPLIEWAQLAGVSYGMVKERIARGWTMDKAISVPPLGRSRYVAH